MHPELEELASREIEAWSSFGAEKCIASLSNDCAWNETTQTIRIYMKHYEGGDLQRVNDICHYEETTIHPKSQLIGRWKWQEESKLVTIAESSIGT